jgi:hypothetical protein
LNRCRNDEWSRFAEHTGLRFTAGAVWDRLKNPMLKGQHLGRQVRLELVWQDTGARGTGKDHSRSRSEVHIGEASTSVVDVAFCVDNLAVQKSESGLARKVLSLPTIVERLEAAQPSRIEMFEGSFGFHMPRVPRTQVELRFYLQLLSDLATELERHSFSV